MFVEKLSKEQIENFFEKSKMVHDMISKNRPDTKIYQPYLSVGYIEYFKAENNPYYRADGWEIFLGTYQQDEGDFPGIATDFDCKLELWGKDIPKLWRKFMYQTFGEEYKQAYLNYKNEILEAAKKDVEQEIEGFGK